MKKTTWAFLASLAAATASLSPLGAETLQVAVGTSDITNIDPHRANGFEDVFFGDCHFN